MSKQWKKILDKKDIMFLEERADAGYLDPFDEVEPTDQDIVLAFDADWRDALHNANLPWDEDFRDLWATWYGLLDKLGYSVDFILKIKKYKKM